MEWAERFERPPTLAQCDALADQIDDVNSGFDLVNLAQKRHPAATAARFSVPRCQIADLTCSQRLNVKLAAHLDRYGVVTLAGLGDEIFRVDHR